MKAIKIYRIKEQSTNVVNKSATISFWRIMPKDQRIRVEFDSGWPMDRRNVRHFKSRSQAREALSNWFSGCDSVYWEAAL